jgi:glycosyltransferase involved in cell wall biosynthesis
MGSIDVVMLTKNSERLLTECLRSIYKNIPVKRLIVVDGSSTDNTLKIIDQFDKKYGNVKVIIEYGSRAKARERGIREVKTEWFMFVDSDVILCKDWFNKARKYLEKNVGAVWGLNLDVIPKTKSRFLFKLLGLVALKCFKARGGTHDILIRTSLVKDIKIPSRFHVFEDSYIIDWIRKKGYNVIVGEDIYCLHFKPPEDWHLKNNVELVSLEFKLGLMNFRKLRYFFYYPFFMLYWLIHKLRNR